MQRTVLSDKALPCACKLFNLQGEFKFGVRKKRKNTNKVRAYLFVVRSTQNKWVLTHLVRCTDTVCLFVCYVRCARFLQMLCACISLCLRSTETCSEQSERNSGTGEYYSPKRSVYAKQSVLRTLPSVQRYRVLIVCYVRCA